MTSAARQAEADRAAVAFQTALTQIGAGTVEEALKLWEDVPATSRASTAASWLRRAITLVMGRRRQSRDLARAYYRLARALRTGSTVADPYHPEPRYVTVTVLREEFNDLVRGAQRPQEGRSDASPSKSSDSASSAATGQAGEADEAALTDPDAEHEAELDRILVEEIEGLREAEERIEREAEQELRTVLEALGPNDLQKKVDAIDGARSADEVDGLRDEAHRQAGARQAAAAERIAMNGGRSTAWNHMQRDRRAIGYIRLSRTGTPCGWCAMLISRGPVYRSQNSAEFADGDKYHDNCHCYAEPVFTREQYNGSSTYELNRRYEELWPQVTRGLSGKAAVSAWRRFVRQEQKAAAQEARRSTTSVQEA
ncbi:head maturation protease [Streptomyces phage Sentinel]|uniref:Capsid maturation protease n=1 Tax=Streptomyces phage Sentinel TaxID=2767584 RepID=A0A873WEB8_9CAUD|nr:head maturation protease [Streptomyces phage Sentinel]QPB09837.1 capsid maturation protease [Streptomyces phage Sentinel]